MRSNLYELPTTPTDPVLSAARNGKIKVAMIGLCGCWGCTLSFLDMDERILPLLTKVTILRRPLLIDIKRITERCAIGFIEGGVANEDNIETLRHFREEPLLPDLRRSCRLASVGVSVTRDVFQPRSSIARTRRTSTRRPPFPAPRPSSPSTRTSRY